MELLKEIYEFDLGLRKNKDLLACYKIRKAARALVFNDKNQIALLFVSKNNYHKLPGGGVEKGESTEEALLREVQEEAGCKIKPFGEIGTIIEYRDEFKILQISYCYTARVEGKLESPSFTQKEISEGFCLKWVDKNEAKNILKNDQPNSYEGKFIQQRDLLFILKS